MNQLPALEINARTVVPWRLACELLGVHDRLLHRLCAEWGIPEIRFTQRSRGILLDDLDKLIAAHARRQHVR